jgi:site-specific DNA-cytosine methylase
LRRAHPDHGFHTLLTHKARRESDRCDTLAGKPLDTLEALVLALTIQLNRTFSVAERKRAMGFPDDFRLAGTPEDVGEMATCTVFAHLAFHTEC